MLRELVIHNLAIVESLVLDFQEGLTVLTGETGAGKSILLDALGLTLGDRADSAVVRSGTQRAEVTATFAVAERTPAAAWLAEHELDTDGECIIRRTVGADGRSRGYVNGQPVPIQQLKELGESLVDIHGQHAHQSLLKRPLQRQLLDDFAGHDALLTDVGETYRHWNGLRTEMETLQQARSERDSRLELLRYQVSELRELAPTGSELEDLDEEHGRLANAARLLEGAQRAVYCLYEGDEETVLSLLNRTLGELRELQDYDRALTNPGDLLEAAAIQVQEAATELRHYLGGTELDPDRLAEVEQRLADIHALSRKHRVEPPALLDLLESLEGELNGLEGADARFDSLESEIAKARETYLQLAGRLTQGRKQAAKRLAKEVTGHMQTLGMKGGRFEVALTALPPEEPSASGMERPEFLVSANPGEAPRPLTKVASGGELSRISLAIQVATAGKGRIPTLIFDEVDVGIGGGVAEMVGRQMRMLGAGRQVLCVTHQPQVAALGHHHVQISKHSQDDRTRTHAEVLDDEERVQEVARMLGGVRITDQTLAHAREMLGMAQQKTTGGTRAKA